MTRLKVHNMASKGTSQADISAECGVPVRGVQRILAEPVPTRADVIAGKLPDGPRLGRPPKADPGQPGRGKTHLAVAIGYRAIQNGLTARFVGASALIDELSAASRAGRLREATAEWVLPDVLIVDLW
ncbi:MAG: hypothetical protein EXR69_09935 [Myxococcales bacterium]|nr:hypothetical protein [Myxococcales bacterium]